MNHKILIAEDSSVISNLTKRILSAQNYKTEVVKNGQEVLKKLESEDYDLILMDIFMPKMDGMACSQEIRNKGLNMPIIAITGNANDYSMEDFEKVGINDFLAKPLNYDNVLETVKKYLTNAG